MHTSKLLRASDFSYRRREATGWSVVEFATFCPDYHPQDRVGVVSPHLEDGIFHTGAALLALTTAFYDVLRARGGDFFDYPQHFALLAVDEEGMRTREGRRPFDAATVGRPWGHLDVWPDSNWVSTGGTAAAMIRKVFDLQIHRLFWPEDLRSAGDDASLPGHARRLLQARLKAVYYYNARDPNVEIRAAPPAEKIVRESMARLPRSTDAREAEVALPASSGPDGGPFSYVERHRRLTAGEFLEAILGERQQGEGEWGGL